MNRSEANLRRRIRQLREQVEHDRKQELARAVEYRRSSDQGKAQYHAGLADGHNLVISTLRRLEAEYPPEREEIPA